MESMPYVKQARQINDEMIADSHAALILAAADHATSELEYFIRGYLHLSTPGISTDDEILNWTLSDVVSDLRASIWNASSGHYKTAAAALRSALEMAVVALYFQHQENRHKGPGYNPAFSKWDEGKSDTPNWGTTKPHLATYITFKQFTATTGYNVLELAHAYFGVLCSFTHSRAFDHTLGAHSNTMWMTGEAPTRDDEVFQRVMKLFDQCVSWIATLWLVAFPPLLAQACAQNAARDAYPIRLFKGAEAEQALLASGWSP